MRQNGVGTLTLEDARTWIEETGLCLFLPRKQFSTFVAPSFVEAVAGERSSAPAAKTIALAEDLLVRLETDGVAVRLNLLGQPGEQPDFVVASWVLPYVYALRGDRDWRRSPQLTGSRAGFSSSPSRPTNILEAADATIPQLKQALGREVTESAVLRAITELWQQLRIIPVIAAPGRTPHWQLLRVRYKKAIAEGGPLAGHGDFGARFHLFAGRHCRQHGRSGIVPGSADGAQQGTRSAARTGCHAAGAHHCNGACPAILRGRNTAGVLDSRHALRQFLPRLVYAGFGAISALL